MSDTPAAADQPTAAPTRKWIAGSSTGTAVLLLLWLAGSLGVDMPPEVAAGIVLAAAQLAAYLKRNAPVIAQAIGDRRGGAHHDADGDGLADR